MGSVSCGMWCGGAGVGMMRSLDAAGFVERKPGRTPEDAVRVALAQVDKEVGADGRALEEGLVHLGRIETGHRAGVQAQPARGDDQVGALQGAVAEGMVAAVFLRA